MSRSTFSRTRGYDAVHLASVLAIDDPALIVATWDRDLGQATLEVGRAVAPHRDGRGVDGVMGGCQTTARLVAPHLG
jgi:hypothetical protein